MILKTKISGKDLDSVIEGDGEEVIFLKGVYSTVEEHNRFINKLVKSGRRVISPKYGYLETKLRPATIEDNIDLIHDFLNKHNLQGADIVGVSLGGTVAQAVGTESRESKVVSINQILPNEYSKWQTYRKNATSLQELHPKFWERQLFEANKVLRHVPHVFDIFSVCEFVKSVQDYKFESTSKPLLMMHGEYEKMFRWDLKAEIAIREAMPKARIVEIPKAGHNATHYLGRPITTAKMVLEYLG